MLKNILAGISVAFMAAVTISAAQSTTARTPDLPLDVARTNPTFDLRKDLETLSQSCALLIRLNVRFRITGTIQGRRVDAGVRLSAIPTLAMRLEPVVASGSPPFVLQANRRPGVDDDEDGTLYIRQGNRVVHHRVSALMNAVIGLPLGAKELFHILTCPHEPWPYPSAQLGSDWFSVYTEYADDGTLETYIHRDALHPWAYTAAIHSSVNVPSRRWRIDFLERHHEVFRRLRIRSLDWLGEVDRRDDITLLREFAWVSNVGEPVAVVIPESASGETLDELGSAVPLIASPSIQRSPRPVVPEPTKR
jgi:hypothetical protein